MYIVTAKEMYQLDHETIRTIGLDGKILMENAGRAVYTEIKEDIRWTDRIIVIVGKGNNGGDGFVIARTLLNEEYHVHVLQVVPDEKVTGDAQYHKSLFEHCGGKVTVTVDVESVRDRLAGADIVVDAMVGIGIKGPLRSPLREFAVAMNQLAPYIISIDIPSGLPADEGEHDFVSVQANKTIIIDSTKMSLFLPQTAPYYGKWSIVSIGIPTNIKKQLTRRMWDPHDFTRTMPRRGRHTHKGTHGRGCVIGGSIQMPGSIAMTAKSALRTGAGLITIGTKNDVIPAIAGTCPEAMYMPIDSSRNDGELPLGQFDAIVMGMGLGREQSHLSLVKQTIQMADCPLILDADALFHLHTNISMLEERKSPTIVTPHPGEMAMLMDITVKDVVQNPFYYANKLAQDYEIYVVLKGSYTIITAPDGRQIVNQTGNQGLAKGGSGDCLSGIILAMVMLGKDIFPSLCNACFLHGLAADMAIQQGHTYHDLLATDVINMIQDVYHYYLDA